MTAEQSSDPLDTKRARELDAEGLLDAAELEIEEELPELTAQQIQEADDDVLIKVPCPEWKGAVFVRNPSAEEKNQFEQESMHRRGRSREVNLRDLKERLFVWFSCDSQRRPLFDRRKMDEHLKWLRPKNAAPVNRVADVVLKLGGWDDRDVEDLVGNSDSAPS